MPHSTLAPVFAGLRLGQHTLLIGLATFAIVRAFVVGSPVAVWTLVVGVAFVVVYLVGAWTVRGGQRGIPRRAAAVTWMAALTLLWVLLMWLTPEGAYLVFPLFFVYLRLLPGTGGIVAIVCTTVVAIVALGLHLGFGVGGVIGPLVGAAVALLIGLAYRALVREAEERERILAELIRTRQQLAHTEREKGAADERARLAREIHDTVAQGLSSIQMLLRAAERDAAEPAAGYLRLARETAADSLTDTRQLIGELTPARLDDGLAPALRRLGADHAERAAVPVDVHADDADLPMHLQTAFLRIAQGALANAVWHAEATRIGVDLVVSEGSARLAVRDDGRGFDAPSVESAPRRADSFGLRAMRERVDQLGGDLEIASSPGDGTTIAVRFSIAAEPRGPS